MRTLFFAILFLAAAIAAFVLLPWWLSLTIVAVVLTPMIWLAWQFLSMLKQVAKVLAE